MRIDPGIPARPPDDPADALRWLVWSEWYGCDPPVHGNDNVRRAGDFVERILARSGPVAAVNEERLRDEWRKLAGAALAAHCTPESLRDGELRLRLLQPSMRFHLEQIKPLLLERLRDSFGSEVVRSIRFVIG